MFMWIHWPTPLTIGSLPADFAANDKRADVVANKFYGISNWETEVLQYLRLWQLAQQKWPLRDFNACIQTLIHVVEMQRFVRAGLNVYA